MICVDCEENKAIKGSDLCPKCNENKKYLDKFILKESAIKGRFCKKCNDPIVKSRQLCDKCKAEIKSASAKKFYDKHKAEYWDKYQKKAGK